jgi:hypothetical protein
MEPIDHPSSRHPAISAAWPVERLRCLEEEDLDGKRLCRDITNLSEGASEIRLIWAARSPLIRSEGGS